MSRCTTAARGEPAYIRSRVDRSKRPAKQSLYRLFEGVTACAQTAAADRPSRQPLVVDMDDAEQTKPKHYHHRNGVSTHRSYIKQHETIRDSSEQQYLIVPPKRLPPKWGIRVQFRHILTWINEPPGRIDSSSVIIARAPR
jgi:hypothetical protein